MTCRSAKATRAICFGRTPQNTSHCASITWLPKCSSMQRTIIGALAATACLAPLACLAGEAELPELGITVRDLPELVAKPTVRERPQGYEASASFAATTSLNVYRQDESVTPGSLGDASYRATVLAPLGEPQDWKDKGTMTSIGSHEAWISLHVTRLGPMSANRITLYTIVDQYRYRIIVTAMGSKPPAEFDAVVKAVLSSAAFEPVRRPVEPEWLAAEHPDRIPRFVPGEFVSLYPPPSIRRGEQGAIDVEFSIDDRGRATGLKLVKSAYSDLGERLPEYFEQRVFKVPRDWEQTGSDRRRFTKEFLFTLAPPGSACPASRAPAEYRTPPT